MLNQYLFILESNLTRIFSDLSSCKCFTQVLILVTANKLFNINPTVEDNDGFIAYLHILHAYAHMWTRYAYVTM